MPYAIKKEGNKFIVYDKQTGKTKGTHDSEEKAKEQVKASRECIKLIWEAQDVKFNVIEEGKTKWLAVTGTALTVCKSKNNRKYTYENLRENDGAQFNWIVGHRDDYDNPDHNVGEGGYKLNGDTLSFDGKIKNTKSHPDIVEQLQDKLIAPSIQGGGTITSIITESGEVEYAVENLNIPVIALVNRHVRGIEAANIEAAIMESCKDKIDIGDVNNINEVERMVDEKLVKEAIELKQKLEEANKLIEQFKKGARELIVESIIAINAELKKDELMEKDELTLNLIKEYEQKLKEQDEGVEGKAKDGAGAGEVETEGDKKDEAKEAKEDILINEKTGDVSMSPKMYEQFNKDIKESIYR